MSQGLATKKRAGIYARLALAICCGALAIPWTGSQAASPETSAKDVLVGLRDFYRQTARPAGSFRPGIDPKYEGMADSAASDLAAVTYAVVLHRTFGWKLPYEERTRAWLLARQQSDGAFINRNGTLDPKSAAARLYNTTQGMVALHALGTRRKFDPLPVFVEILKTDYRTLPPYTTSFFPLAYRCAGKQFPAEADGKLRRLMRQARDGYLHNHIAATFHMVHYDRLLGQKTNGAGAMILRTLADQKADGSWMLNPLARDRHATFDAVFVLHQLGADRQDCARAIARAARWALRCRNEDGGFGHYPGSPSDADAVYFQVGTLVMAGYLKPAKPLPPGPELYSWGHLMPVHRVRTGGTRILPVR
jgi:geranylgeranyl transferase type-2 subunit beta